MEHPEPNPADTADTGNNARPWLAAGGITALLASACCVAPLALLTLGISGAWIGLLTALEPYSLIFSAASIVALGFAWRRIWRPAEACADDAACAQAPVQRVQRWMFVVVAVFAAAAIGFPFAAPLLL